MKKIFLVLLTGIVLGCTNDTITSENKAEKIAGEVTYSKDPRTGLCFATITSMNSYGNSVSITCVPCDSVKKLLPKDQQ